MAGIVGLVACSDAVSPTRISNDGLAPRLLTGTPTTTNLVVTPASPVFGSSGNNVVGVPLDAAAGFASGSLASNGTNKTDMYFTPESLFGGREVTLGDVASIAYFTKTGATHVADPRDWFLNIYTKPYVGDVSTPTWYGDRVGAEPYFSSALTDPANTWNQWSTGGSTNRLRFFESTQGAPGATFGSYVDPDWATFLAGNSLSGSAYAGHAILFFSIQTGSAWAPGFTGQVDGLRITLTDGSVATVNFETEPTPPIVSNVLANPNPAAVNATTTLTADVSDVTTGGSNIASAQYSLNGGTWTAMTASDGAFDEPSESVTAAVTSPATPAIYSLCVHGTDAQGSASADVCTTLVVYDPNAGFVTGGGWMNSPAGSAAKFVPTTVWDQGFESDASGWFDSDIAGWEGYGDIERVPSGTNGVASLSGSYHATVAGVENPDHTFRGPFSRFDGYRGTWTGTWVASIAVYLDPGWTNGVGFDYSVATSNTSGGHRRDFIFHVTKDNSSGKLLVAGSTTTNFAPRQDLETINHYEVQSAGWYTLRHTFRDQGGVLAVDLQLVDAGGTVLFTETRSDASDLIPSIVGGNRYAWFTHVTGITLAVDDHQLTFPVLVDPVGKATFGFVSKYVKGKTLPTGQTEFVFAAGDINFHSSSYEWLIVNQSGTNAQFKGSGTINGSGNYTFMLWAGDGDKDTNPATVDTFRIKIWNTATNEVVYDNLSDTAISGGNIMIQIPKK
jgi:hypothetical protein